MGAQTKNLAGLGVLIVGASSGVGHAVAMTAAAQGANLAVAARRMDLLTDLADGIGGFAFELDVQDDPAIRKVVSDAAAALGGLDVVVYTSTVAPFADVEDIDLSTWQHAVVVNALGANNVLRAALPHLSEKAVVLITSSNEVGHPRAGAAAYCASKAALHEILHSWRNEHPHLSIIRVGIGPTANTEILRGADRELLARLYESWERRGQVPSQRSALQDVANTLVSLISMAYANPTVVPETVQLAPRIRGTGATPPPKPRRAGAGRAGPPR